MFHRGHLNILKRAKEMCDYLIVGVSTDEVVREYKHRDPVIPYEDRAAIVEAIKYVDKVVPQINRNKLEAYDRLKFDIMFVGDDWKGSELFQKVEVSLMEHNVRIIYFPYTPNISSSLLRKKIDHDQA